MGPCPMFEKKKKNVWTSQGSTSLSLRKYVGQLHGSLSLGFPSMLCVSSAVGTLWSSISASRLATDSWHVSRPEVGLIRPGSVLESADTRGKTQLWPFQQQVTGALGWRPT